MHYYKLQRIFYSPPISWRHNNVSDQSGLFSRFLIAGIG